MDANEHDSKGATELVGTLRNEAIARRAGSEFRVPGSTFRSPRYPINPRSKRFLPNEANGREGGQKETAALASSRYEKITKRTHALDAPVQGSEFKAQSSLTPDPLPSEGVREPRLEHDGKLRNGAMRWRASSTFQVQSSKLGPETPSRKPEICETNPIRSTVTDRRYSCARRAGSRFRVQGSKSSENFQTNPFGSALDALSIFIQLHAEQMGNRPCYFTKRTHALEAPVQSSGFKVQSFRKYETKPPMKPEMRSHGLNTDKKLPNEAILSFVSFEPS